MASPDTDELVAAIHCLAKRDMEAFAWADEALIVRSKLGALADFVLIGQPLTSSVIPLLGFEELILELRQDPTQSITLPHVLLDPTDPNSIRINLTIFWAIKLQMFLLNVSRAVAPNELQLEYTAQVRARAIAEADATNKARQIAMVNAELTRINTELEAYASVISHDLRSPLRRLRYYANDAERALSAGEMAPAIDDLRNVRKQAMRMGTMLADLFEYARLGHTKHAVVTVDTRALIQEIIDTVERPRGMNITLSGEWPMLVTAAQPLDIVLRNLIDNAIRHHDQRQGEIAIASINNAPMWQFTVSDDGPGIEPQWHDAIFEPYRSVGDPDETRGQSGFGLALVKRSMDVVGARIQVASPAPKGRGTSFTVWWPRAI